MGLLLFAQLFQISNWIERRSLVKYVKRLADMIIHADAQKQQININTNMLLRAFHSMWRRALRDFNLGEDCLTRL